MILSKKIMREVRSNSLLVEERGGKFKKIKERKTSYGAALSLLTPLSRITKQNTPDPASFVSRVPVINVPTKQYIETHRKFCLLQINKALGKLETLIKEPTEKIVEISIKTSSLVQDINQLFVQRQSYIGRGLNENRTTFFLLSYLNQLKIKESSLKTRDYEVTLEYLIAMQKYLQDPPSFSEFHLVINLNGYINSIPQHKNQLSKYEHKISILKQYIKLPAFSPPPQSFEEQLIYPTSSTYTIFKQLEKKATKKNLSEVYNELKDLTDESEELSILLHHAFTFGWMKTEFPFLLDDDIENEKPNTFLHCKVKVFDPQYINSELLDLEINQLRYSNWPFSDVVDVLDELFFTINPFEGAKIFYKAMDTAAKCVAKVTGEETYLDFDTLFPLIFLSVLASGLLCDYKILLYISKVSTLDYFDSEVTFAASYVEAILAHIKSLDENGIPLPQTDKNDNEEIE